MVDQEFCKGEQRLEDEEHRVSYQELTITNWKQSSKLIILKLCENLPRNSLFIILWSFKKLEMWKSLVSGCLMSCLKKKKMLFWSVIFSYCTQQQQAISWSNCAMRWKVDSIQQLAITSSVVGLRRSSKALPKARLAPKKCMVTLVVCYQSDSLQLSKSQWNHYIWEVCSANRCDTPKTAVPTADIGQ